MLSVLGFSNISNEHNVTVPLQHQENLTQQHSLTFLKTWIHNKIAVKTSDLTISTVTSCILCNTLKHSPKSILKVHVHLSYTFVSESEISSWSSRASTKQQFLKYSVNVTMHLTCAARDGVYMINTTGNLAPSEKKIITSDSQKRFSWTEIKRRQNYLCVVMCLPSSLIFIVLIWLVTNRCFYSGQYLGHHIMSYCIPHKQTDSLDRICFWTATFNLIIYKRQPIS